MPNRVAIIPARGGSKGLKNKNIFPINNKPLIYWTIQACIKSKIFNKIIVSTDSPVIAKIALDHGAEVPFLRPKNLSSDHAKTIDVIRHVINKLYFNISKPDYIYILQPTSPLRTYKNILDAKDLLEKNNKYDSLVSVQEVPHIYNPESLYENFKKDSFYLKNISSTKNQKIFNRHNKKTFLARNGAAIYITTPSILKNSILGKKVLGFKMNKIQSIDIDDYIDLFTAEYFLKNKKKFNI